jgi:hypothetical protein
VQQVREPGHPVGRRDPRRSYRWDPAIFVLLWGSTMVAWLLLCKVESLNRRKYCATRTVSANDDLQALLWRACVGWYVLCVGSGMLVVRLIFSVATYLTVNRTA